MYRGSIIYNLRIIYFRDEHGDIFLSNNNFNLINCVEKYPGLLKKFFLLKKKIFHYTKKIYDKKEKSMYGKISLNIDTILI